MVYLAANRNKEFKSAQSAINYVKRSCRHGDYVFEVDKTHNRLRRRFMICADGQVLDMLEMPEFANDTKWFE